MGRPEVTQKASGLPDTSSPHSSHILATARQLEVEVSELKSRADELRSEQDRWTEHNKNGIPRRETAAIDHVFNKAKEATEQEKKARESEHRASTEKRALEQVSRDSAERVKQAEDMAKRAEYQLVVAEASFQQWKTQAQKDNAVAQTRREKALRDGATRLATVQKEAEERRKDADEDVKRETARSRVVVEQERCKLAKAQQLLENRGKDRLSRVEARLHAAEVAAQMAEAKRDRQLDAAAVRSARSRTAAESKVHLASLSHGEVASQTLLRFDVAKSERVLRLEAAQFREVAAVEAGERRARAAEEAVAKLEKERVQVHADCAEVEREYELMVDRFRRELTIKADTWECMAREAEAVSRQKVLDVQVLAAKLKVLLQEETEVSKAKVAAEVVSLKNRLTSHSELVQGFLAKKRQHTTKVLKLAGNRVEVADAQMQKQVEEVEQRCSTTVDLVNKELELTKVIANTRVHKAVDQLMSYLDEGSRPESRAGLTLDLWIPLPGSLDDMALPGMPQ